MSALTCIPLSWPRPAAAGNQLKLFQSVMPACRFDIPACLFLMPYLLHNVLAHGTDDARQSVQQEIKVRGRYGLLIYGAGWLTDGRPIGRVHLPTCLSVYTV